MSVISRAIRSALYFIFPVLVCDGNPQHQIIDFRMRTTKSLRSKASHLRGWTTTTIKDKVLDFCPECKATQKGES